MSRKLTEAINVQGADLIGTAKGYDLFDIRTYEAAQQFVVENTNIPAGTAYVHNEATFNGNIDENQRLYFFVESNTNKVYAGVVKGPNTNSNISIPGERGSINIEVNFLFETNTISAAKRIFPFFLIPGIRVDDAVDNLIIKDNTLLAVLPQLTPLEQIDLDLTSFNNITKIDKDAFYYRMDVNTLTLGENIQNVPNSAFDAVQNIVITWIEKPEGWSDDWDKNYRSKINYLHKDEIENIKQQKAREAELEQQRAAEAERERREQQYRQLLSSIKYKKEGKEITILGVKPSFKGELIIPDKIDNLPVTRIAPFAFYANDNITSVQLPDTLKIIGQGAFAFTYLDSPVKVPQNCRVSKNAWYGQRIR